MDCPHCGGSMRAATIICQNCGHRLKQPVQGSGSPQPFDRSEWGVLPPYAPRSNSGFMTHELPIEALVELVIGLLDLFAW